MTYTGATRDIAAMYGLISVAPSEQLMPAANGSACSIEVQKASTVWPDRLRPLRSTIVTEMNRGSPGATSLAAAIAAFPFRVSKIVSMSRKSAPPSRSPRTASAYPSLSWSKSTAR